VPIKPYTESDEITLIFPNIPAENQEKTTIAFNGKVQKIATLASGYCSVRFAYHLSQQKFEDNEKRLVDKIHEAYFDARVFNLPTEDIYKNVYWRQNDCQCNSMLNLGYAHLRQAEMEGLGPNNVKQKLMQDKGIDYYQMPATYRLGMIIKKAKIEKEGFNPKDNLAVKVTRTVFARASIDISDKEKSNIFSQLLLSKYSNDSPELSSTFEQFYE